MRSIPLSAFSLSMARRLRYTCIFYTRALNLWGYSPYVDLNSRRCIRTRRYRFLGIRATISHLDYYLLFNACAFKSLVLGLGFLFWVFGGWGFSNISPFFLRQRESHSGFLSIVRHPRPVRESSCPTWSFLPVAWFLSDWCFPFPLFRSGGLEIQFPRPLLILSFRSCVSGPLSQR